MALQYEVFDGLNEKLPEIPAGSVVSRRIYHNDQIKVSLLGFAPGQSLSERTPLEPAILEIWRGDGVVVLGDEAFEVGPGSWVYVGAETPHSIQAKSELVILVTLLRHETDGSR
jgi:quercetin dioxygenase-like cupin family protein